MRRATTVMLAATMVVALSGSKLDCEHGSTHPSAPQVPGPQQGAPQPTPGTPNPQPADPTPHRTVTVQAGEVELAFLPATIVIDASPIGFHHEDHLTHSNVARFRFEVPDGMNITVTATLTASNAGSKRGWCLVESGPQNSSGVQSLNGARQVLCQIRLT